MANLPTDQEIKQALTSGLNEVKKKYPELPKARIVAILDQLIIEHQQSVSE